MGPLYAYSLLPVIAVGLLLCFTAMLRGRGARGLAVYCLSVAAWCGALLLVCYPRTAALGQRLAAVGAFTAAGYLHAAYDMTRQRSYRFVWLAYAAAVGVAALGAAFPTMLHQRGGLGMGPLFWPTMALAIAAAVVPLLQLTRAYRAAPALQRGPLRLLFVAGLLAYVGALGNALLLAAGIALPFGLVLVLGALLVLGTVIRQQEDPKEQRLLERSLRYSALAALTYGALLFGVLYLLPAGASPLLNEYRAGAILFFCTAALALEPVRAAVLRSLGRKLFRDHADAGDLILALAAQEARADQAARLAELGTFVSAVAHEVRNPLGVLSANLKLLERRGADQDIAQAMREQIARASHFVDELLTYGRPRALEVRLLDADAVADLALSTAQQGLGAAAPQARIERVRTAGSPLIEADQAQLVQLLVVLIENALLALDGAPAPALRLATALDVSTLRIRVEDSGPGVPPELLPRLFQPFVTSRTREGPRRGTGLGLAIARGIALRHGGTITAGRSDLGGALFELTLPRVQPLLAPRK